MPKTKKEINKNLVGLKRQEHGAKVVFECQVQKKPHLFQPVFFLPQLIAMRRPERHLVPLFKTRNKKQLTVKCKGKTRHFFKYLRTVLARERFSPVPRLLLTPPSSSS